MTRVACAQLAPIVGDLDANRALTQAAIDAALADGAEVVVVPELVTSGYMLESLAEARSVAIRPDDALLGEWAAAAARHDAVVVGGFCEAGDTGEVFNSAAIVDGSGVRAVYRKLHLWDREKLLFTPGEAAPPVVDTRVGRVATMVCYDLEFPELTRAVALEGAQLLAVPTNWPDVPAPDGERPPEVVVAMAAARVNRMAIAVADRAGTERGQAWTQGTTIVGADGWVAAQTREPETIGADVDLDLALDKQLTEHAHALGDRRPELYGRLVSGQ